jgi:hypothetical protein
MKNMLVQYVRKQSKKVLVRVKVPDKKDPSKTVFKCQQMDTVGDPVGVLVAYTDDSDPNHYLVGFAMCNRKDKFDRVKGLGIASDRAIVWSVRGSDVHIPATLRKAMKKFLSRCDKYFKGKTCVLGVDG